MKTFSITLLTLLFWLSSVSADQTHIDQSRDCFHCHEDFQHDTFESMAQDVCGSCHRGALTQKMALQAVKDAEVPQPALRDEDQIPGMTLPLTYQPSRLGHKPNTMALVPAGIAIIGSDNRLPDESPQHKVTLPTYYIDIYEVTNLQYQHFLEQSGHRSPIHFRNRQFPPGRADHPVNHVSWFDAKAYCEWADKRLPSNEEWEKSARGEDSRTYPWGDTFGTGHANTPGLWKGIKRQGDTTPVGAFPSGASPYGVHDMAGNLWEWTASSYAPYPGNQTPAEPYKANYKTLKGGSWWDCSFYQCGISAPVFNRSFFSPKMRNETIGFRCAKDYKEGR